MTYRLIICDYFRETETRDWEGELGESLLIGALLIKSSKYVF